MSEQYILAIDQSTSGTKALLFSQDGELIGRCDRPHRQIVNDRGWVEHDANEIYQNTVCVVKDVVEKTGINKEDILGVGISNQRETAMAWNKQSGEPVFHAIVWQCTRGEAICSAIAANGFGDEVKAATGLHVSPYFSAAKLAWILQNVPLAQSAANEGNLYCGTMDSWLVYKLTHGKSFKTDFSNASRTQMFNICKLKWDETVCGLFGIKTEWLAQVCDSNSLFGETDFEGYLPKPVPIHSVMGDSHGALFGQGCLSRGMIKTTYGTGSSVMMNIGKTPVFSKNGVVTSIAWSMDGKVDYVLEGNINYTGAVMKWIVDDLGLIPSAKEASKVAAAANKADETYLVPAFTGLGAPYWDSKAKAMICGMTRSTGKAELVRAAEECIAYQIADIIRVMSKESGIDIQTLRVDGGPTKDSFLMQFQSDILDIPVIVPATEELSGVGSAYAAGIALGVYDRETIFQKISKTTFEPLMDALERQRRTAGWKEAVSMVLAR
nr:glycerol kinase [uncultured Caproiciproducens sp.]